MAAKICSPISSPTETGNPHTELGKLLESYIWCARAEGKSRGTIEIRITAVLALIDFLRSSSLSTCVHDISADEQRTKYETQVATSVLTHIWVCDSVLPTSRRYGDSSVACRVDPAIVPSTEGPHMRGESSHE
ncbi:MAG: hypothetical protein WBC55_01035 [Dehalococcoidia bacterium]